MADKALPQLECDLVMRGGITSGLVYPRAVAEISKHYIFRSIGGTSAGAIAASVTAAAEYGRRTGRTCEWRGRTYDPFARVGLIPQELSERPGGGTTALMQLFQPQAETSPLHRLLLVFLDGRTADDIIGRVHAFCLALLVGFPVAAFLGALPGFLIGSTVLRDEARTLLGHVTEAPGTLLVHVSSGLMTGMAATVLAFALLLLSRRSTWLVLGGTAAALLLGTFLFAIVTTPASVDPMESFWVMVARVPWALPYLGVLLTTFIVSSGALLGAALAAVRAIRRKVPANMYGLCTGIAPHNAHGVPGLTDWLHGLIQAVAGRPRRGHPLTVGDLWHLERFGPGPDRPIGERAEISLALVTSNVTLGLSHRFPQLETWRGSLYFRKADLERLFPTTVVAWMIAKAQQPEPKVDVPDGTYRIPAPHNLPVILGARLSLSFPFLLSAIPLYMTDWSDEAHAERTGRYPLRVCHFSDGGLTSNFPIQIFDAPIPSRPTFGINLLPSRTDIEVIPAAGVAPSAAQLRRSEHRRSAARRPSARTRRGPSAESLEQLLNEEVRHVWMPDSNDAARDRILRFNRFHEADKGNIAGFFEALFDTARNWADTEKMFMPGYRDRIVHVSLSDSEGGLNLNMEPEVIQAIGRRGEIAGRTLVARFASTAPSRTDPLTGEVVKLDWDNHRWVRYRAFMASVEGMMLQFAVRWQQEQKAAKPPAGGGTPLPELLRRSVKATPNMDFRWQSTDQFAHAHNLTDWLVTNAARWRTLRDHNFTRGAPTPTPLLRMVPPDEHIDETITPRGPPDDAAGR